MSGTLDGGQKAAAKNIAREPDFYRRIGTIGGQNGNTGGFAAATSKQVKAWGAKGGRISRRKKVVRDASAD